MKPCTALAAVAVASVKSTSAATKARITTAEIIKTGGLCDVVPNNAKISPGATHYSVDDGSIPE